MTTSEAGDLTHSDRYDAITKRRAAEMLHRSAAWIEHQIEAGVLVSYQERHGGPHLITTDSILGFIAQTRRRELERPVTGRTHLRLVWVNPRL